MSKILIWFKENRVAVTGGHLTDGTGLTDTGKTVKERKYMSKCQANTKQPRESLKINRATFVIKWVSSVKSRLMLVLPVNPTKLWTDFTFDADSD